MAGSVFSQNLYKKPQEIINPSVIQAARQNLQSQNPDALKAVIELTSELSRYTEQFVDAKSIEDERRADALSYENINVNTARLIEFYRLKQYDRSYTLGESPYLSEIHSLLGRAYEIADQPAKALLHYENALRYSSPEKMCSQSENPGEDEYLAMAEAFSEPDRIAQTENTAEKNDAEKARPLILSYGDVKRRHTEAVKRIDVVRAEKIRGIPGSDPAAVKLKADALKAELDGITSSLKILYNGSYLNFCKAKNSSNADLFYRMSQITKKTANKNNTSLSAYADLLESAQRLDPENLIYLDELVSYYKNRGMLTRAIDLLERRIKTSLKAKNSEDLSEHYFLLGGLYSDGKNYILAAESYEKYFQSEKDPGKLKRAFLPLADLHFKKTGNLNRALELYEAHVSSENISQENPNRLLLLEKRYDTFLNTAGIYRRKQRTEKEEKNLSEAVLIFRSLEKESEALILEKVELQKKINALKVKLFDENEETPELAAYYRLLRVDKPELERKISNYKIRMDSMFIEKPLERMAVLAEYQRRYSDAVDLHTEIVRRNRGKERDRSRNNLERIQLTLQDGLYRKPELPPVFER